MTMSTPLTALHLSLLKNLPLLLEIVSEPGYVLLLLIGCQVRVLSQSGDHQFHEVTHWPVGGEPVGEVPL